MKTDVDRPDQRTKRERAQDFVQAVLYQQDEESERNVKPFYLSGIKILYISAVALMMLGGGTQMLLEPQLSECAGKTILYGKDGETRICISATGKEIYIYRSNGSERTIQGRMIMIHNDSLLYAPFTNEAEFYPMYVYNLRTSSTHGVFSFTDFISCS